MLPLIAQLAASGASAVGAFYNAKSARYALESEAVDLEAQASASALNARQAELDAQQLLGAGRRRIGLLGFQQAQVEGSRAAGLASGNVAANVGSAAETTASNRYAYAIDTREVEIATAGAVGRARTDAQNSRNATLLAFTAAKSRRRFARGINPWLTAAGSFFSSASPSLGQAAIKSQNTANARAAVAAVQW